MVVARRGGRLIAVLAGLVVSLGSAGLFAQDPAPEEGGFVGNKLSRTYHKPTCELVKRITAKNKVELASTDEASLQRFKPCAVCKPNAGETPPQKTDDAENPDGDMPAKGKTKKAPLKGSVKKAPAEDDAEKPEGVMPTKAKGKRGNPKAVAKKGETSKKTEAPPADEKAIKFSRDIAPILAGNCTRCHNPQQKRGQFDMTTFAKLMAGSKRKVITPGNPDDSLLILKVRGEQPDGGKMPPGQTNLAAETIAKLEEWVKAGARLDAGFEPTATLDSIAPTPETIRRNALAKMSTEERDKKVTEVGLERWKKASAKTTPEVATGKNFLLFSNLPKDRAERLLKTMETQRMTLGTILGPNATALTGLEKISLFVFNDVTSYVEFVRSNENRELEQGIEGHGRLDVEQPYVAVADPLNGGEESAAAAAAVGGTPKKSGRSKKAKEPVEEAPDGPERTLAGLVSEHLAASAANAGGKPPRWLSTGLGVYLAYQVDPKGSPYYRKLREETFAQFTQGWETKANELLGGDGSPEAIKGAGFSVCEWFLSTPYRPRFPMFVQGMLQGGEKLDDVIHGCFGPEASRAQFLQLWGNFVGTRYASLRRR